MKTVMLFLTFCILLGACGSSGTDESADQVDTTSAVDDADVSSSSADDEGSTDAASDDASEDSEEPWATYDSPIQDFLGVDYSNFDSEDAQAEFAAQEREAQEKITTCMRELGWEYVPMDGAGDIFFGGDPFEADGLEYGSAEWVAKYGLGITTQAFGQGQVGPDLVGYDDSQMAEFDEAMADQPDPNAEYVNSLSEAEQEAYFTDLYGDQPEFDDTLTEEEQEAFWNDWEPTGCQSVAYDTGFGGPEQAFYEAFGDELDEMYERVSADPRIVAQQSELADCLAESGHSISADEDPWQQFYEMFESDMESLYESSGAFQDPSEGLDPESMSEEEINEILDAMSPTGPELGAEQLATLAELQQRELDLAADLLECEPGFFTGAGQDEIFFEVLAEYEQEFLDQNAAALSEFENSGAE